MFYSYDPAGSGQAAFSPPRQTGQTAYRVDTGEPFTVQGVAVPEWGLYDAIVSNVVCDPPEYYDRVVTLSFEGTVGQASGLVREAVSCVEIPIAELYDIKSRDVSNQDNYIRYNTADTSLNANWWIVITEKAQQEDVWIGVNANTRAINAQAWPSGPNQPVLAVYNAVNGRVRREPIPNQATWDTIQQEIGMHLQATSNATKASGDALDASYGDGTGAPGGPEWTAVANHDPADIAWGYPPTVELGTQALALLGG